jgi:hypothetical protein
MDHLNLKFVSVEGCCIMTNTVKTWHYFCAVSLSLCVRLIILEEETDDFSA